MPRKKVEKPEVVEEKSKETMDRTPDGQEEAVYQTQIKIIQRVPKVKTAVK